VTLVHPTHTVELFSNILQRIATYSNSYVALYCEENMAKTFATSPKVATYIPGVWKHHDFRPISRYISQTIPDSSFNGRQTCMRSIESIISNDLDWFDAHVEDLDALQRQIQIPWKRYKIQLYFTGRLIGIVYGLRILPFLMTLKWPHNADFKGTQTNLTDDYLIRAVHVEDATTLSWSSSGQQWVSEWVSVRLTR